VEAESVCQHGSVGSGKVTGVCRLCHMQQQFLTNGSEGDKDQSFLDVTLCSLVQVINRSNALLI
jgi:hypothetical protein